MNFQQSIMTCFSKYADFNGRASTSECHWFAVFLFLAHSALSMVSFRLEVVLLVATLLPSMAVAVRRLHDTGRSGWWLLIGAIPIIGWMVLLVFTSQKSVGVALAAPYPS